MHFWGCAPTIGETLDCGEAECLKLCYTCPAKWVLILGDLIPLLHLGQACTLISLQNEFYLWDTIQVLALNALHATKLSSSTE